MRARHVHTTHHAPRAVLPLVAGVLPHTQFDPAASKGTGADSTKLAVVRGSLSSIEIADRIIAQLLAPGQSGPILLCMPGTASGPFQSTILAVVKAMRAQLSGPMSIASIPYPNGVLDVITRFLGIGSGVDQSILALVIRRLHKYAPNRPILIVSESQGSWVVAHDLRTDPTLAAAVTRVASFSRPDFAHLPDAVGQAHAGRNLLPGSPGIQDWVHTDDIVPALFNRLGPQVLQGYAIGLAHRMHGGEFGYAPHHYEAHGAEAARWLLTGVRPANPVHPSSEDIHASSPAH